MPNSVAWRRDFAKHYSTVKAVGLFYKFAGISV